MSRYDKEVIAKRIKEMHEWDLLTVLITVNRAFVIGKLSKAVSGLWQVNSVLFSEEQIDYVDCDVISLKS